MASTTSTPAIGQEDRGWLLAEHDPAVTLYLRNERPLHALRAAKEKIQALLNTLEQRLLAGDLEPDRRQALLATAEIALSAVDFATTHAGFVLFLAGDRALTLPLPRLDEEQSALGHRFLLRPILDLFEPGDRFHILAMSAGHVRLIEATRDGWQDRTPADLLRSPTEVAAETTAQNTRQATPHSYESPEELRKSQLIDHIQRVSRGVRRHLAGDPAPVVLVAEPEVAGHVRKLDHWPELMPDFVNRNPAAMRDRDLHGAALALLPPADARSQPVLDRIRARLGTAESTVAIRLEEILAAARDGRVDALLVATNETIWGCFDGRSGTVAASGSATGTEEDLLNLAAVMTLEHGGRVFGLPRDRLPREVPAAAILRY